MASNRGGTRMAVGSVRGRKGLLVRIPGCREVVWRFEEYFAIQTMCGHNVFVAVALRCGPARHEREPVVAVAPPGATGAYSDSNSAKCARISDPLRASRRRSRTAPTCGSPCRTTA